VSSTSGVPALTTAGFQVLLALASGHSHGYAVMGFVDQLTDGKIRLGPGTLSGRWPGWWPTNSLVSPKRMIRMHHMTRAVATTGSPPLASVLSVRRLS
jgi:hypothetical protein